jgi:hypothetical protein
MDARLPAAAPTTKHDHFCRQASPGQTLWKKLVFRGTGCNLRSVWLLRMVINMDAPLFQRSDGTKNPSARRS